MPSITSRLQNISVFLEMIKFSHTIFALPFALAGAVLAARGMPSTYQLFWIVMAMIGARTAAMAMNRLIDAEIDSRNPRTSGRAIPAGLIGKGSVLLFTILATLLMLFSAWKLNPLCLKLSPIALFFLVLYSYCKRFTAMAHIILGICLAAAPVGAWMAIRGAIELPAILLGLSVLFWVSGFDILYALQDLEFDRGAGLHSIPVRLGIAGSLRLARLFHCLMLLLLVSLWIHLGLGWFFAASITVSAGLLTYEHLLLRGGNLEKLDAAFFNMNGYISVVVLAGTILDTIAAGRP